MRIHPHDVIVAVRRTQRVPAPAAVARDPARVDVGRVYRVGVARIDEDCHVIESALAQLHFAVHASPRCAAVDGAEHAAFMRLDDRINDARIRSRNRDPHFAERPLREPRAIGNLGPVRSAVDRFIQRAAGTAAGKLPRRSVHLPHRRVNDVRVFRVDHHVIRAGLCVNVQDAIPGFAAVGGFEDAACFVVLEHMAQRGNIYRIRATRVDSNRGDRMRVAQTGVAPRFSRVD